MTLVVMIAGTCWGGQGEAQPRQSALRYRVAYATYFGGSEWEQPREVIPLSPDGAKLVYSTYIGGAGSELIRGLAVTAAGEVYLAGNTNSDDLPFMPRGAAQPRRKGGHDGIIIKLTPVR